MGFLQNPPAANPSAMPAQQTYSAAMERQARANGFRNADQMMQWARQRNTPSGGTIPAGGPSNPDMGPSIGGTQPMSMYPRNILNYILGSWKGATGGN